MEAADRSGAAENKHADCERYYVELYYSHGGEMEAPSGNRWIGDVLRFVQRDSVCALAAGIGPRANYLVVKRLSYAMKVYTRKDAAAQPRRLLCIAASAAMLLCIAACGAAAPEAVVVHEEAPAEFATAVNPAAPTPTLARLDTSTARSTADPPATIPTAVATLAEIREERMLEVEWPSQMRLGESDTLRLALIPSREGYAVTAEFEEHEIQNSAVTVAQMEGYALWASARLDGTGFALSPVGEQLRELPAGQPVSWRWTLTPRSAGRQRVSVVLLLRWVPLEAGSAPLREREVYSRSLTVHVVSFLGLTAQQAALAGFAGLGVGGSFSLPLAAYLLRPKRRWTRAPKPNMELVMEQPAGLALAESERLLIRSLFHAYSRVTLEAEFRSGYSGARTFLVLPVRADGRSDAFTIAKLGDAESIRREFENYETFVKDTLPPITARIQETPVEVPASPRGAVRSKAALRYTFIGEPGKKPVSLRQALLENPDPEYLERLFATFGPGWWMQRRPYIFRAAQEYDRVLPSHFTLEPAQGKPAGVLDGRCAPVETGWRVGQVVRLRNFRAVDTGADEDSVSLRGDPPAGQPVLRLRWMARNFHDGALGRIAATRDSLIRGLVAGLDLPELPDPLRGLEAHLAERIRGTQSILHGDLNLENILTGPGGMVWLIDFAQTREGHSLADFAHLYAELIAHVIAPAMKSAADFIEIWRGQKPAPAEFRLLLSLESIAGRCLFNPSDPREHRLACFLSALGALKYANLNNEQRRYLYLASALIQESL